MKFTNVGVNVAFYSKQQLRPHADEHVVLVPNIDWDAIREAAAGCPVE